MCLAPNTDLSQQASRTCTELPVAENLWFCTTAIAMCLLPAADGHALRPALLWMDMRSADQAAEVAATKDIALQVGRYQPLVILLAYDVKVHNCPLPFGDSRL